MGLPAMTTEAVEAYTKARNGHISALVDDFGIPKSFATELVERLIDSLGDRLPAEPAELPQVFNRMPFSLWHEVLLFLGRNGDLFRGRSRELLSQIDPADLMKRMTALENLRDSDTPLYTRPQLQRMLKGFLAFLDRHREDLVATGLPLFPFWQSPWLYRLLGRTYDTRATGSYLPWVEIFGYRAWRKRVASGEMPPAYRWVKGIQRAGRWVVRVPLEPLPLLDPPGQPVTKEYVLSDDGYLTYEECSYEQADFLRGLSATDAIRLEDRRREFWELKRAIIEAAWHAIEARRRDLVEACLSLVFQRLSSDDIEFYLRMDRFYVGCNAASLQPGAGYPPMIPGGLVNLLELVGHVAGEIEVGRMHETRSRLPKGWRHPRLEGPPTGGNIPWTYLALWGAGAAALVDPAIDAYQALTGRHVDFWSTYCARLKHAFTPEVIELIWVGFGRSLPEIQRIKGAAAQAADSLSRPVGMPAASSLQYMFSREEDGWRITFGTHSERFDDLVGLFHIRDLLTKPHKSVGTLELAQDYNQFMASAAIRRSEARQEVKNATMSKANSGFSTSGEGGLGKAYDQRTIKALQEKRAAILVELDTLRENPAKTHQDVDLEDEKRQELDRLDECLRKGGVTINQDGYTEERRPARQIADPTKQVTDRVGKTIDRAMAQIKKRLPDFYEHLMASGLPGRGHLRMYAPTQDLPWEF